VTEVATEEHPKTESEAPAGLSEEFVRSVEDALEEGAVERAAGLAASLHAADQADLLEQLGHDDRQTLVAELMANLDPQLLTHLDETVREEVLTAAQPQTLAYVAAASSMIASIVVSTSWAMAASAESSDNNPSISVGRIVPILVRPFCSYTDTRHGSAMLRFMSAVKTLSACAGWQIS
jgi:hypothetical protein